MDIFSAVLACYASSALCIYNNAKNAIIKLLALNASTTLILYPNTQEDASSVTPDF